jgi:hypothetical protein
LPKPFWRYQADRQFPQFFTSAFGTKIMGLHHNNSCIVQLVDVRARTVVLGPRTNCPAFPIYFSVGSDKLFAIDAACFELCCLPLVHPDAESDSDGSSPDESESESDSDSDSNDKWSWRQLPEPPFTLMDRASSSASRVKKLKLWPPHSSSTWGSLCGNVSVSGCYPSLAVATLTAS